MSRMGAALQLIEDPLLKEIFAELERSAIERGIYAKSDDDETRRSSALEVRAIRDVRRKLESLSKDKTNPAHRPAAKP